MTPGGGPTSGGDAVRRLAVGGRAAGSAGGKDEEAKKLAQQGYVAAGEAHAPVRGVSPATDGRLGDSGLVVEDLLEDAYDPNFDVEIAQASVIAQPIVDVPAERAKRILESCRPRQNESPRDMFFRWYGDHAFQRAALDRLSTFAIDVDTASYTLARKYLAAGQIPPKEAVRTEEFVNYFKPDLRAPTDGSPFAIWLEAAPSPFGHADGKSRWLLRVGVRAKDVAKEARAPLRLAFVVDTSGSMAQENRLELVKHGLRLLASQLEARDKIAIVRFASDASVVLQWTSAADRASIEAAIHGLAPNGSTNAEAGLKLGYDLAVAGLDAESTNRVVILSDGVANTGQTDQDRISADVKDKRQRGIYLNAIGVGMGNHNDVFLERLADQGDGLCSYIDDEAEAKRALVDQFVAQTTPVARDVKIQLEFDPAQVDQWRQLGYENRAIADVDFRNDAVDAGEVGAGHQIVALYEIELAANAARGDGPLTTIRLRYKQPFVAGAPTQDETAQEIAATIPAEAMRAKLEDASPGFQQSALVAQFAEFLRRSVHARGDSIDDLLARCVALAPRLNDAEFTEFAKLVDSSRTLILSNLPRTDELTQAVDSLRRNRMLSEELRQLAQAQASDVLKQLEEQNRKLEDEIRRLIEQRVK
ncbi:MAG: von Willebrand factor type A domain-containing protein [Planctomycetes bacterium]|nr:von Willebrand factor type A domain-containing protein [Planctomycetota bacterium]